jgi:hypothetical protein
MTSALAMQTADARDRFFAPGDEPECLRSTDSRDRLDAVMAAPGAQLASLGPEWPMLRQLCLGTQPAGNDRPDVWLAAAVEQHAEHLVSFDRDSKTLLPRARFTHLKV